MKPETVKVAITQADDNVAIMSFITLGRGDVLPFGAEWADKAAAIWMREPTATNLQHEIDRTAGLARPIKDYRMIDAVEIPIDRTFRNALRDRGGKLEVDMYEARKIHLERIRVDRAAKFLELDGEWMKATGQKNNTEADAIEAQRQVLRDLTADPRIEAATTPEALKALWPAELGDTR
jgi:hypothetical protein